MKKETLREVRSLLHCVKFISSDCRIWKATKMIGCSLRAPCTSLDYKTILMGANNLQRPYWYIARSVICHLLSFLNISMATDITHSFQQISSEN